MKERKGEEEGRGGKKREVELTNGLVRKKRKMYIFLKKIWILLYKISF